MQVESRWTVDVNSIDFMLFGAIFLLGQWHSSAALAQQQSPAGSKVVLHVEVTTAGGINFYTDYNDQPLRSFAITPAGSLIAGGVSNINTPETNVPPTIDPAEYDAHTDDERQWIHDLYFGRYEPGSGQPRLHTRGLIMWGRGDSPDIQMGRTGPDNATTTYGPPEDTQPGTSLGKMIFTAWGDGQFQGDIAGMYARNDTVPTGTRNPGSLHLGTAGESAGTESEQEDAWRDMIDRLVISSQGYVAIGDRFTNPTERLHVNGNILANQNLIAAGDVVARGALKVELNHPNGSGKKLVYAAITASEPVILCRGEARLEKGRAVIELPAYFEQTTVREGRTVMLTNVDGFDRLAIKRQDGRQVADGRLIVISDNLSSAQAFSWEVKGTKAGADPRPTPD